MSICVIDHDKINEWRDWCIAHEISLEEILRMSKGEAPLVGDRSDHILYLPNGFRFVFSIENTPALNSKSVYKIRRLSGSINKVDRYPNQILMKTLCEMLGFGPFEKCIIRLNDKDPIPNIEINEIISIEMIK